MTRYAERHVPAAAATDYAHAVAEGYFATMFEAVEQPLLRRTLDELALPARAHVLDVACGSGRITGVLAGRFENVVGLDVSPAMIDLARARLPERVTLVTADIGEHDTNGGELQPGSFDLVTAFRLYLNASASERDRFLDAAARLLRPGGVLLFNVHVASSAPLAWYYRLSATLAPQHAKRDVRNSVSVRDCVGHVEGFGFDVFGIRRYGILPRIGSLTDAVSSRVVAGLERLANRPPLEHLAQMFLVLAVRTGDARE